MAAFRDCRKCAQNFSDLNLFIVKRFLANHRRDDVYFLKDQDPPKHSFQEAIEGLRAYAFTDENVALSILLDNKIKKVW